MVEDAKPHFLRRNNTLPGEVFNPIYSDGYDAAIRQGKYKDWKGFLPPPCPHSNGSQERDAWYLGFGDGTDDLDYALHHD